MAESAERKQKYPWRSITGILLVVVGFAGTTAIAATVTAPTISGGAAPVPGSELIASGTWTPASAKADYDWLRCDDSSCTAISGACGPRYEVRSADEGYRLIVRLTVTESGGQPISADSAPTNVVTALPPPYDENVAETNTCVQVTPTGPGEGTFTSGTQTGGGSEPAPDTTLPFIDPFPVVRIAGRFKGKRTTLTRVAVSAPKGSRIRFNCKGRGCPYKRKAVAVKLIRVRSLQRTYRPKATIEIRITEPKKIGKYTRLRTRRGKAPVRLDRCLMPGKSKPVRCPTG